MITTYYTPESNHTDHTKTKHIHRTTGSDLGKMFLVSSTDIRLVASPGGLSSHERPRGFGSSIKCKAAGGGEAQSNRLVNRIHPPGPPALFASDSVEVFIVVAAMDGARTTVLWAMVARCCSFSSL